MRSASIQVAAALLLCATCAAFAHRIFPREGPPPQGIAIPSLTHGQMVVISDSLSAIRDLARNRANFDMTIWRLEDYLSLQSFVCFWGLAPGSIADEDSPFNECAHAYLAAGRALLLQLSKTPQSDSKAVQVLIGRIEIEMLANGASLTICRYSDEPFNTNEIIWPHWEMIARHPPSAALAAGFLAAMGATFALIAWRRRPESSVPPEA